jgi:hypothetical protein
MKKVLLSALLLIVVIINGCDNSTEPGEAKTSGETTINTVLVNMKITGFSFSAGGNISYPNTKNVIPDIIVLVQQDEQGNITGVFLSPADSVRPAFRLLKSSTNADSAAAYFNNLTEVPDSDYNWLALSVRENQVLAVKTVDEKYGAIQILHTQAYTDSSDPNSPTVYGEAKFKWKYQPNGSRIF